MEVPLPTGVLGWPVQIWSSWSHSPPCGKRLQNEKNIKREAELTDGGSALMVLFETGQIPEQIRYWLHTYVSQ